MKILLAALLASTIIVYPSDTQYYYAADFYERAILTGTKYEDTIRKSNETRLKLCDSLRMLMEMRNKNHPEDIMYWHDYPGIITMCSGWEGGPY